MYNGIINVYKEAGFTSHDVVAKLRGILKQKKIGHTGTLDPDAVGVLPVCLGSGTKLCSMLTDKSKEYRACFLLGKVTDTQDISGTVLSEQEVNVTKEQTEKVITSFIGEYEQLPPMYSAIKINGKRLYELAREGKEVERQPRLVHISNIQIEKMELPLVTIKVGCSKGTYIRTLCHDIGQKLGCGAVMTALERTRAGDFRIEDALTLQQIETEVQNGTMEKRMIRVEQVFTQYRQVTVQRAFCKLIDNGNSFCKEMTVDKTDCKGGEIVRVYNEDNLFYGIYEFAEDEERFKPVKLFMEK